MAAKVRPDVKRDEDKMNRVKELQKLVLAVPERETAVEQAADAVTTAKKQVRHRVAMPTLAVAHVCVESSP
jgi:hypothetical protein